MKVTGASSGFGQLTAQKLAQEGCWVFGTSRKKHPASVDVEMLTLDGWAVLLTST